MGDNVEFVKNVNFSSEFVELMVDSGGDFFEYLFGEGYEFILRDLYSAGNNVFGYENVEFLVHNGEVIGMHLSMDYRNRKRLVLPTLKSLIRIMGLSRFVSRLHRFVLSGIKDRIREGDYYLSNIAVKREYRGKGFGKIIMKRIIELAREKNCSRVVLLVEEENSKAINFYRKLSFERSNRVRVGRIRLLRMVLDL